MDVEGEMVTFTSLHAHSRQGAWRSRCLSFQSLPVLAPLCHARPDRCSLLLLLPYHLICGMLPPSLSHTHTHTQVHCSVTIHVPETSCSLLWPYLCCDKHNALQRAPGDQNTRIPLTETPPYHPTSSHSSTQTCAQASRHCATPTASSPVTDSLLDPSPL